MDIAHRTPSAKVELKSSPAIQCCPSAENVVNEAGVTVPAYFTIRRRIYELNGRRFRCRPLRMTRILAVSF